MMKSMTGVGVASSKKGGRGYEKIEVEVSSINSRRGLDTILNLPRVLFHLDRDIRALVEKNVRRGRVVVTVNLTEGNNEGAGMQCIDQAVLSGYRSEIGKIAKSMKMDYQPELGFLLGLPGVFKPVSQEKDTGELDAETIRLIEQAIDACVRSKSREGAFLCRALKKTCVELLNEVKAVNKLRPGIVERARTAMHKRIHDAGLQVEVNDERLLKEVALFADRSDITEEVTRLEAHLEEMKRLFSCPDTVGRTLDFTLQEIGREVNTIGSKANDIEISKKVVILKTELEKIREQVQNLE